MKNKITILTSILLMSVCSLNAEIFTYQTGNQTTRLENFINNNTDGIIEFESGQIYLFNSPIDVYKAVIFKSTSTNKSILRLNVAKNFLFRLRADNIRFENLTLDGNNLIDGFGKAIVDIFDIIAEFKDVLFTKSKEDAIGAYNGRAIQGLLIDSCIFREIDAKCIFISNRNTEGYGSKITEVRAPITITNSTFETGSSNHIISDNGNDFYELTNSDPGWVSEDNLGGRRYEYSTNLKLTIQGNTFEEYSHWSIGLVQADNVTIIDNDFAGPTTGTDRAGNASTFHFEQFSHNFTIAQNTFRQNTGGLVIFNSGREGRQRYRDNPVITTIVGKNGFTGNSGNNTVRGSNSCPSNVDPLTCKKDFHHYGPRNFYIYDNKFITQGGTISSIIAFQDAINFRIGYDKDGNSFPNDYSESPESSITNNRYRITNGELGSCGVYINEPTLNASNTKDFSISSSARLNNEVCCIQINAGSVQTCGALSTEDFENRKLSPYPTITNGIVNLPYTENGWSIYSVNGMLISQTKEKTINLIKWSSGLYFFRANNKTWKVIFQ